MRTISTRRSVSTRRDGNSCAVRGGGGETAVVVRRRWCGRGGGVAEAVGIAGGGQSQCKSATLEAAGSSTRSGAGCAVTRPLSLGVPARRALTRPSPPPSPPLPRGCLVNDHAGAPPASCLSSQSSARPGRRARRSRGPPPCLPPAPAAIRVGVGVRVGVGASVRARVS